MFCHKQFNPSYLDLIFHRNKPIDAEKQIFSLSIILETNLAPIILTHGPIVSLNAFFLIENDFVIGPVEKISRVQSTQIPLTRHEKRFRSTDAVCWNFWVWRKCFVNVRRFFPILKLLAAVISHICGNKKQLACQLVRA